jgi:tetratricopeptide (TPR) repeat protein
VRRFLIPIAAIVATACVVVATIRDARSTAVVAAIAPSLPASRPGTSRTELSNTVAEMSARLKHNADDSAAVLLMAEALLRLQRVNRDGRAVIAAEEHLRRLLDRKPAHYEARRLLAAVLMSQHRFGEGIAEADRARAEDPRDPWNYGVMGDGYIELGDYDRAFESFDRMGRMAPGPSVYARTSYALELKGDLDGALEYMRMAAEGTSPNDPESQAWHYVQIGDLLLQQGHVRDGRLEYERAMAAFPNHPLAIQGLARVKVIDGDLAGARLMLQQELARAPGADLAAAIGDLCAALGEAAAAEPYFRMAEQIERATWVNGPRQPHVLARYLIDQDRNRAEALALAEEAARARRDIFTMDVLASAYLKAGRLSDARKASDAALRTGTRDARVLWHAAEIRTAAGDRAGAQELLNRIPSVDGIGDVRVRAGVRALRTH